MMRFRLAAALVGACTLAAGCQQTPSPHVQAYPQQMPIYQQPQMPAHVQPTESSYQQIPGGSVGPAGASHMQGLPLQHGGPAGQPLEYSNP